MHLIIENAKFFSKSIQNTRVDIMQETGHIPMEERPYESLELFLNFINFQICIVCIWECK